jgi:hypothetical protein
MVMDLNRLTLVSKQVAKQLFISNSVNVDGNEYKIKKTNSSSLKNVTIDDIMFMEQNQRKKSKWAQMAKQGHEIIWIFKDNTYIGRIIDENVTIF